MLNEADLEQLDDLTGGTVTLSKAVVVNATKDITSFNSLTGVALTGSVSVNAPNVSATTMVSSSMAVNGGGLAIGSLSAQGTFKIGMMTGVLQQTGSAWIDGDLVLPNDHTVKAQSFVTYSDVTLKKDIKAIENPLEKVMSMRGISYQFKHEEGSAREVGFLAQEMRNTVPEVIHGEGDGNLGIDYAKLTSVLVEAVKAQQVQIDDLKAAFKKDN